MRRLWILAGIALAGCATYQPKPITPAQLAERFETRSFSSNDLHAYLMRQPGFAQATWPLLRWNRQMLMFVAYHYSPALGIARAQWQSANAGVDAAALFPDPSLQIPFDYTLNHQGPGRPVTTGLVLDIPIVTAHKREYRIEQASHLSEAARQDIRNQAWIVYKQLRDTLLTLYADRQRIALLEQQTEAQKQVVDMLAKRRSVGEAAQSDIYPASLALLQARAALVSTENEMQTMHARLATILGMPVSALAAIRLDFDEFAHTGIPAPSASACRLALFQRADLLGSLARYDATQSALQLEIAKQYPDIHIGPGYTYDVGANKIDFGLTRITLPLFNRNRGGIEQAEAQRAEAAARTAALQDTLLNDLEQARVHYQKSLETLRLSTKRLATARDQLTSQQENFNAGNTDRLAMTQADIAYLSSALDHLKDVVASQQAAGALEDAMQMPLTPIQSKLAEKPNGVSQ